MLFDKALHKRLVTIFFVSVTIMVVSAVGTISKGVELFGHAAFGSNGSTFTFFILFAATVFFGAVAYVTTGRRYTDQYRVRELIDQLFDVLDDLEIRARVMNFHALDADDEDHLIVSVWKWGSNNIQLLVEDRDGIQCELYVSHYRVEYAREAGTLLPLAELPYVRALVRLIYAQADAADANAQAKESKQLVAKPQA